MPSNYTAPPNPALRSFRIADRPLGPATVTASARVAACARSLWVGGRYHENAADDVADRRSGDGHDISPASAKKGRTFGIFVRYLRQSPLSR